MPSDYVKRIKVEGLSEFRTAMSSAAASVKQMTAAEKLAEAQYKATGDAEAYQQAKAEALRQKLEAQKKAVEAATAACAKLEAAGVAPDDSRLVAWKTKLTQAQTALTNINTELSTLEASKLDDATAEMKALGTEANTTAENVASISTRLDREAVIKGINAITDAMSNAAAKALQMGKAIWSSATDAASWGEEMSDAAEVAGMDVEAYQRLAYAAQFYNTSADTIVGARKKIMESIAKGEALVVGGKTVQTIDAATGVQRDWLDVLFDVTGALGGMEDQAARETAAMEIFGRGYDQLTGLMLGGRDAFEQTMGEAPIVTEEQIKGLADANTALKEMDSSLDALKMTGLSALAGPLQAVAAAVAEAAQSINAWLNTDEGRQKMQDITEALTGLVSSITEEGVKGVVDGITGAINGLTGALGWLSEHSGEVVGAIKALFVAFGLLKTATLGLNVANTVNGIKGLLGSGAGAAGASAGSGAASAAAGGTAAAAGTGIGARLLSASSTLAASGVLGGAAVVGGSGILAAYLGNKSAERDFGAYNAVVDSVRGMEPALESEGEQAMMALIAGMDAYGNGEGIGALQEAVGGSMDYLKQIFPDLPIWDELARFTGEDGLIDWESLRYDGSLGAETWSFAGRDMVMGLADSIAAEQETLSATAEQGSADAAADATAGFVEGIDTDQYYAAGVAAGQAFDEGMSAALDIHSPSRVMANLGRFATAGFVQGITGTLDQVESAAALMAGAVAQPIRTPGGGGGDSYSSASNLYIGNYYQRSDADLNDLQARMNALQLQANQGFGRRN